MATPVASSPTRTVADLVHGMVDLVPLPQAYIRIREIVEDPDSSLRAIAEIITSDPALTGRVLRLANSAYMAQATRVDSIDHAVRVLGLSQIHDIALATSAVGSLSRLRGELFDIFDFWRLSVYCAVSARHLAMAYRLPSPPRMFISGLMHNIGNLVIAHELPEEFEACRTRATASERPYHELQREMLGFDYAEVGAELMWQWNLPAPLVKPVALHTNKIARVAPEEQASAAVMQIAAATARAAAWQSAASEPVPDYDPIAVALTGVTAETIEEMMQHVDAEVVEFIGILLPGS